MPDPPVNQWTIRFNDDHQPWDLTVTDAELHLLLTRGHIVPKNGEFVRARGVPRTSIAGLLLDENAKTQAAAALAERSP